MNDNDELPKLRKVNPEEHKQKRLVCLKQREKVLETLLADCKDEIISLKAKDEIRYLKASVNQEQTI